jgi:hypothetical protein
MTHRKDHLYIPDKHMHNNLKGHISAALDSLELVLDSTQKLERDLFAFP